MSPTPDPLTPADLRLLKIQVEMCGRQKPPTPVTLTVETARRLIDVCEWVFENQVRYKRLRHPDSPSPAAGGGVVE